MNNLHHSSTKKVISIITASFKWCLYTVCVRFVFSIYCRQTIIIDAKHKWKPRVPRSEIAFYTTLVTTFTSIWNQKPVAVGFAPVTRHARVLFYSQVKTSFTHYIFFQMYFYNKKKKMKYTIRRYIFLHFCQKFANIFF